MCKNANTPCPGCKKHSRDDAVWMFFTDEERQTLEAASKHPPLSNLRS
jgi:predicted Fe-S protein YdhL (DUF1289 family)